MRQRKPKDLARKLAQHEAFLLPDPAAWRSCFRPGDAGLSGSRPIYLEIGCGKGDFIIAQALAHPQRDYLAIEGQEAVILRGLEKAAAIRDAAESDTAPLENLRFACSFVQSLSDVFPPDTLSGIYLNFSDPWPKARHAKRRLTYRGRLLDYAAALRPGGAIEIKTDNDALFDFTLEEIAACGWTPAELSRDLHGPGESLEAGAIMTEYEKKFAAAGKTINYVKVIAG